MHSQLWLSANYKFDFGVRSQLIFDGSLRTADLVSQWKQQIIRFNYLYRFNKIQVGGGFLFSNAYNYSSTPVATKEYRPFLHLSKRVGVINMRARWETRLFDTGSDIAVYNRFRVQARYNFSIFKKKESVYDGKDRDGLPRVIEVETDNWSMIFSNELMYQSRDLECFGYDQNRAYIGINWQERKKTGRTWQVKKIAFEFGYAAQFMRRSAGKYELDHMFMLMFSGN